MNTRSSSGRVVWFILYCRNISRDDIHMFINPSKETTQSPLPYFLKSSPQLSRVSNIGPNTIIHGLSGTIVKIHSIHKPHIAPTINTPPTTNPAIASNTFTKPGPSFWEARHSAVVLVGDDDVVCVAACECEEVCWVWGPSCSLRSFSNFRTRFLRW